MCHTSAVPVIISAARSILWERLMANIDANTFLRSNRSERYPVNGVTRTLGIIAVNVTTPTHREESDIANTSQPRATIRAHEAA